MLEFFRRLAVRWCLRPSAHKSNIEEDCDKSFHRPSLSSFRVDGLVSKKDQDEEQPPDFTRQAPCFSARGALDSETPIHNLPTEVILEIVSNTTPCSRACLALSSKRLFCVISDGFSDLFADLRLPAELPQDHPSCVMANDWPLTYQPERWKFLCLLQKDSRQWLACSDCFVLHPAQWFGQTDVAAWPLERSWPQCRPLELDHLSHDKVPRGIVDRCPCIKLTPGKKRTLLAYLQRNQQQWHPALRGIGTCLPPADGPWWHECQAVYSRGTVNTKLHPYLLQNGGLGIITEYTISWKIGEILPLLRLSCPHQYACCWRRGVFFQQSCDRGREAKLNVNSPSEECVQSRQCRYCSTRVIGGMQTHKTGSSYTCVLSTERNLSDRFWIHQIIFPFPRHTKVLYPESYTGSPGSSIERYLPLYDRTSPDPQLLG